MDADGVFGPQTAGRAASQKPRRLQSRGRGRIDMAGTAPGSGTAAPRPAAVVEGKGYQVSVSRASKSEAELAARGPVAKSS